MDYQKGLISIIVPIYNTTDRQLIYTKMCLNFIVKNATRPYELFLVDDGSDEATKKYLNLVFLALTKLGIKCKVFYSKENRGVSYSFNKGFAEARGEYLCSMDADVCIPYNWMGRLTSFLDAKPGVGVVSGIDYYSIEQIPQEFRFWLSKPREKIEKYADRLTHDPISWNWFFNICYGNFDEYADSVCVLWSHSTPFVKAAHWMIHRKVLEALKTATPFDEEYVAGLRVDSDFVVNVERNTPYKCEAASVTFCHHFGNTTHKLMDRKSICEKNDKYFYKKWGITESIKREDWR